MQMPLEVAFECGIPDRFCSEQPVLIAAAEPVRETG